MRIAVSYDNAAGTVLPHFDRTAFFKLYDVDGGEVRSALVIAAPEQGHDALAAFLAQLRANVLICGGIGGGARAALEGVGVILYGGVAGDADTAVNAFLAGTLAYDPDVHCHHRDAGEGTGCAHDCRSAGHDCGSCRHFPS